MVTSGAIARGMRLMELAARPRAMDELQAASAVGQGDLFRAYEQRLAEHGTRAAQVLLTAADIAARTNYLNARQTLRRLIEWGVVPVVNENDTTATDEITFGDNDFLAAQVAILLEARLLVLLTNVDGVFTADPRLDPEAELIADGRRLRRARGARRSATAPRPSARGGMRSKVAAAEMASEAGVPAVICNGTGAGTLLAAAAGERGVGTSFAAARGQGLELQALAQVREADPRPARSSTRAPRASCARAAPACCRSGSPRSRATSRPATRSRSPATATVLGKGIVDYSARRARAGDRA